MRTWVNAQSCFKLWTTEIEFVRVLEALLVVFDQVPDLCDLLLAELNRLGLPGGKGIARTQAYLKFGSKLDQQGCHVEPYVSIRYLRDVFK